ncbi:MAG: hypothetical protein Fur002_11260 [Anaerolineales bacterium]
MKKNIWTTTLPALALILASCGISPSGSAPQPTLAATQTPQAATPLNVVIASAEAQPAQEAQIAAPISAPIQEIFVQEGDAVKAGDLLMTLYAPDLAGQVTQAELAEQAAELEFQYWIPYRHDRPPERKQQAQAEWDQKKMSLEVARANFAQTSLYAPFDGVVISLPVQAGEYAQAGRALLRLADTAHMQIVTTDLSERDILQVKTGQPVSVYFDALNVSVSGKVVRIAPQSQTVGGDVVFPVFIELDQPQEDLRWGMSAEVEIQTE